jgi:hypothetical protein
VPHRVAGGQLEEINVNAMQKRMDCGGRAMGITGRMTAGVTVPFAAAITLGSLGCLATAAGAAVRPAGQEGAFAAVATGPAATSWNPANLALFPERRLELFALQAGVGNDSYTLREYQELNGAFWDDDDKETVLGAIHGSTMTLSGQASLRATGISWGHWAFSTETRGASRASMPKEALELLLYGNTVGETFNLEEARAVGVAFTELRLSFGGSLRGILPVGPRALDDWCAGVSAKMLQGWGYGRLLEAEGGVTTTVESLSGDGYFRYVTARGGRGFGFDLGLAGPLGRGWTGSVAVRDIAARLKWTRQVEERTDCFEAPGISLGDDDEVVVTESVTVPLGSVATSLPAVFSAAVAHEEGRLLTGFQVEAATERAMGASPALRGSAGAAWTCKRWLALRGSLSIGGEDAAAIGGGAGLALGPVQLDLGLRSWGSINPFASKGIGATTSLGAAL